MTSGSAARRAALEILRAVRAGALFDDALTTGFGGLPPTDARLAHEIAAGVLRNRSRLDARLQPLVRAAWHRVPHDVRDLLRIGAYQMLMLHRIPPYAAVQETVEAAKQHLGAKSAGMVNAVLRRISFDDPPPSDDLATRYSHPQWLVEKWRRRFGDPAVAQLLSYNNTRPPLFVRPASWTMEALEAAFTKRGLEVRRAGVTLEVRDAGPIASLPGYDEGGFLVQDETQARLIDFAAISTGARVWDVAAAPGGKTASLAASDLLVSDARRDRVPRLRQTLSRIGAQHPIFIADGASPPLRCASVDVALVDAPCSGTGTFRRHPDARWRLSMQRIRELVEVQARMLDGVAPIVRPGGLLVYLTCSLEPEENEDQIEGFLARHGDFHREGGDQHIMPFETGTDGGFGSRLRRMR